MKIKIIKLIISECLTGFQRSTSRNKMNTNNPFEMNYLKREIFNPNSSPPLRKFSRSSSTTSSRKPDPIFIGLVEGGNVRIAKKRVFLNSIEQRLSITSSLFVDASSLKLYWLSIFIMRKDFHLRIFTHSSK
jgi:hypothetical protein